VALDQGDVGYRQVQHLHGRGHRRLGYAAIDHPVERPFNEPRVAGARRACLDLAMEVPVVVEMAYTRPSAVTALEHWRAAGVTGIAAFNDLSAIAILAACRSTGVAVPGELAVIGVDDMPVSSLVDPALTTVSIDLRAPAQVLAARILGELRGLTVEGSSAIRLPLTTIQRDST
jgi:DNA-binding LacI/PurR family transcriptional regulator